GHNWNVVMPDGRVSTTFAFRPDQQLSFLQAGRKVNPLRFTFVYAIYRSVYAAFAAVPVFFDSLDDHSHYFKYNLDYINLYDLIRLEEDSSPYKAVYMNAYDMLRRRTQSHGNPHFNMIDRALKGPNGARDTETIGLLNLWLLRPQRDYWVDLRGKYPSCGADGACNPIQNHIGAARYGARRRGGDPSGGSHGFGCPSAGDAGPRGRTWASGRGRSPGGHCRGHCSEQSDKSASAAGSLGIVAAART